MQAVRAWFPPAGENRGVTPPIFFGLAKENGLRPVQKKNALAAQLDTCVKLTAEREVL